MCVQKSLQAKQKIKSHQRLQGFSTCFGGWGKSFSSQILKERLTFLHLAPGSAPAESRARKFQAKCGMFGGPEKQFSDRYGGKRLRTIKGAFGLLRISQPGRRAQPAKSLSHLDVVHTCTQMLWTLASTHMSNLHLIDSTQPQIFTFTQSAPWEPWILESDNPHQPGCFCLAEANQLFNFASWIETRLQIPPREALGGGAGWEDILGGRPWSPL